MVRVTSLLSYPSRAAVVLLLQLVHALGLKLVRSVPLVSHDVPTADSHVRVRVYGSRSGGADISAGRSSGGREAVKPSRTKKVKRTPPSTTVEMANPRVMRCLPMRSSRPQSRP